MAHEIKTPLTLIKVPLRKVVRETKGIPQISNSLKIIGDNTERLINLTNQLLDFRETEISEYQLELQECAIDGLLTKVFESFLTLADQKGLLLKLNTPTSAIDAVVDVDALEKILYNLLSNAVKYCEAVVEVSLQAQDNSFSVEIINDGSTISDEYAGKIFEPFFRVRHEKMIEGTGLGLPLARMLAQAHGGGLVYFIRDGFNVFLLTMPINIEGARNDLKLKPNNYLDNR